MAQYYNFLRLGFEGYRRVQQASRDVATLPRRRDRRDRTTSSCITDGSELPVFAFTLKPGIDNYTVFDLSERLRDRGWLVPAYSFPENRQDLAVLRDRRAQRLRRATSPTCSSPTCNGTPRTSTSSTSPLPDAAGESFSH